VKVKFRYTEINIMETLGCKSNCRQHNGDRRKAQETFLILATRISQ
jgi:hypothetical protein